MSEQADRMNDLFQSMISGVLNNAERDLRLARAAADAAATAKAQARYDTLQASMEIYAAAHKQAYGARPWPQPQGLRL